MREGGRIILTSSNTACVKGVPKHAVYSGSKGAIDTFVRCMAIDCGDKKITVNAVAPGAIKTDMFLAVSREYIPNGETFTDEQVDEVSFPPINCVLLGSRLTKSYLVCRLALSFEPRGPPCGCRPGSELPGI